MGDGCRESEATAGEPTATVRPRDPSAPLHPAAEEEIPLERGSAIGRYLVLDRLGAGGMGVVYAGYDPELDRRVALKLLRPGKSGTGTGEARLLREAQAIARLAHPNVVSVYDVGTYGGEVFVAMEHVDGRTLRLWLGEQTRSWKAIVEVFRAAGEGLAAAHDAGLAHRDFKPDNVLIGRDGGVKVVDFGLARPLPGEAPEEATPSVNGEAGAAAVKGAGQDEGRSSRSRLSEPLTEWGLAAGTPVYMSPEQRRGLPVGARSDQYSFCVALWEALFQTVPDSISALRPAAPPSGAPPREVPALLRQILEQGLAESPEARYPTLRELLDALGCDPRARRRRWLLAAATLLAGGSLFASFGAVQARRAQLCRGGEAEIARVWNGDRRSAIAASFAATTPLDAREGAARVSALLDRYAGEWARRHDAACAATRLQGDGSEELLDRKMLCLGQRRDELAALVDLLAHADARVVEKGGEAVGALGDLAACTDSAALSEVVPLPHDPAQRRRVAAAQRRLARVKALKEGGRPREALRAAQAERAEAVAIPYPPLQAAATFELADCRENGGDFKGAEEELYRSLAFAEAGRDDLRRAEIGRKLAYTLGYRLGRADEGLRWVELARAALRRAGGSPRLEAAILSSEGAILQTVGRLEEARSVYERQLEVSRRAGEGEDYTAQLNLAAVRQGLGDFTGALSAGREGLRSAERALGPRHPTVASAHFNLGLALSNLWRDAEAETEMATSLRLREALFGPDHVDVAESLAALGAHRTQRGRAEQALPLLERALATYTRIAPGSASALLTRMNLGDALRSLGRYDDAERELRAAKEGFEAQPGEEGYLLSVPLLNLAQLEVDRGRAARALPYLDRAAPLIAKAEVFPGQKGLLLLRRAEALWAIGVDRRRALLLAREARAILRAAGPSEAHDLEEAEVWLRRRGASLEMGAGPNG